MGSLLTRGPVPSLAEGVLFTLVALALCVLLEPGRTCVGGVALWREVLRALVRLGHRVRGTRAPTADVSSTPENMTTVTHDVRREAP